MKTSLDSVFRRSYSDHIGFRNNEIAAMLVYRANPVEVELFCYVRASSVPINLH